MQRFFLSLSDIHQFTRSLRWNQQNLRCQHCNKNDQWVSHGFSYKQLSIDRVETVGKRILCSNRFGRAGCGRTHRLYCADRAPSLHYSVSCCITFLIALLFDLRHNVESAYRLATGAKDARNAWRWLGKLSNNIATFRTFLLSLQNTTNRPFNPHHPPLANTIKNLISRFHQHTGKLFQFHSQNAFL